MKMMKNLQNVHFTQKKEQLYHNIEEMLDDEEHPINKALNVLRKPTSMVIMVLISAVLFLGIKFGHNLQHEIDSIHRKVDGNTRADHLMGSKLHGLESQLNHLDTRESKLDFGVI